MVYDLTVLNISLYGSGLSRTDTAFSDAASRQCDYARSLQKLIAIVPASGGSETVVHHSDRFLVYPVTCRGAFSFYVKAYKKARTLQKEYEFNVVMTDNPHIGGVFGVWLAKQFGALSLVHSMADMIQNPWYRKERFANIVKQWCMGIATRHADFIRVSTKAEVERLQHASFAHKIARVPFYIDVDAFSARLADCASAREQHTVLYVGRLGVQKDLLTLLKAFRIVHKDVPMAKLILVGDGGERRMLETYARKYFKDAVVVFKGAVPYAEVAEYFAAAEVFAISSLYEGTCMVLHEAAAARLALVATDFAGAKDFIRDGEEGYLAPVRDHHALANAIRTVLLDTNARTFGENARKRLAQFDRAHALSCWEELCARIAAKLHTNTEDTNGKR